MRFPIGFNTGVNKDASPVQADAVHINCRAPKKSVVQVHFPARNMTLAYYNDAFDLHRGDIVYVDGKLEGLRGRVVEVNYTFKIKLSDYKRVIGVADTDVKGQFYMAGSHFVTFDPTALPFDKVNTWFNAPEKGEEYASGYDESFFSLNDLSGMKAQPQIVDRGHDYFLENRVVYVCVDGFRGYAIIEGTKPYTVEFIYDNGEIRGLTCSCFCSGTCKHEVAAMLQLRETLELIEKNFSAEHSKTDFFAAISKATLFTFAIDTNESASFTL